MTYARVSKPAVRLHECRRAKILVLVPPVTRATGRAAGAENALVQAVKLPTVLLRLQELALRGRVVVLQIGLYRLVLLVEVGQVRDEVLDDIHWANAILAYEKLAQMIVRTVRKRVDLGILGLVALDAAKASKRVLSVDVHRAGAADTLAARATESECRVDLILDLDECVEDLGSV